MFDIFIFILHMGIMCISYYNGKKDGYIEGYGQGKDIFKKMLKYRNKLIEHGLYDFKDS